jgi:hypothetical protein
MPKALWERPSNFTDEKVCQRFLAACGGPGWLRRGRDADIGAVNLLKQPDKQESSSINTKVRINAT